MSNGIGEAESSLSQAQTELAFANALASASLSVTGPLTNTQLRLTPVPVSGSVSSTGTVTVLNGAGAAAVNIQDGGNSITVDGVVSVTNFPATQPISAASLPLPTSASTSALQTSANSSLASIDTKLTSPLAITGSLTDTQLRATPVPVSGSVTTGGLTDTQLRASAVPVSLTSTIANAGTNLNTSLLALDSTVAKDASLTTLNTSVNTLLKPASTLAAVTSITNTVTVKADTPANQVNAFKVDGSAVTQPISAATLPLPSGAATSAKQDSLLTELLLKAKLTDTQPVSLSTIPINALAATSANQTNGTQLLGSQTLTKKTVTASTSGDNTIHTPAAGKKVRLYFFGYSAGLGVTGVLCGLKFGVNPVFDQQYLTAVGQPYARNIQGGKRYVEGAVDEALKLNLSGAQTIYTNVELEEI